MYCDYIIVKNNKRIFFSGESDSRHKRGDDVMIERDADRSNSKTKILKVIDKLDDELFIRF